MDTPPVASGTLSLDLATNRVSIRDLKTSDYTIDTLDVTVPGTREVLGAALTLKELMAKTGAVKLPDMNQFMDAPLNVDHLKMHIPQDTTTQAMVMTQADALKNQGITDIGMTFQPGNKVEVSGHVRRGLTAGMSVPFTASGQMSVADATHARVSLTGMHVAGIIPVPGLLQSIILAMADPDIDSKKIERQGNSFLINVGQFVPSNLRMGLTKISTENGAMVIEGGPAQ